MLCKKLKLLNDCKIPFLVMIVKHKRDIDGKFNVFNELPAEKLDVSPKTSGSAISLQRKRELPYFIRRFRGMGHDFPVYSSVCRTVRME